jgi:hypothetical protein
VAVVNSIEALVVDGRALEHVLGTGVVRKKILEFVRPSCCHAEIAVGGEVEPLLPKLEERTLASRTGKRVG